MKKTMLVTMAATMMLTMVGCGNGASNNTEALPTKEAITNSTMAASETMGKGYCGTWELDHLVIGGAEFTLSELEALGEDMSLVQIVIKNGGLAYVTEDGDGEMIEWSENDVGIALGEQEAIMVDNQLRVRYDEDATMYFKKISDSQLIELPTEPETQEAIEETEALQTNETNPVEETSQTEPKTAIDSAHADGMRPEFKEAMDVYEDFYDEYCEFMKKYNENPSDLTLLTQYGQMMGTLVEMDSAFQEWEAKDLNSEELKYYLDVSNRVMEKLLDAMGE